MVINCCNAISYFFVASSLYRRKTKSSPTSDSTKKNLRERHRSVYNRENVLEVNEKSCKHNNQVYWRADFHEGKEFEVDQNDVDNEPI